MRELYFRAMARIELMAWSEARVHAAPIREEVFVAEQGVPAELEMDEADAECLHAVAFDGERAVATGRLLPDGHIGRMAVLEKARGRGVGSALLLALMDESRRRGNREAVLNAQVQAQAFYERHGYALAGAPYDDAGIPHVEMRRRL